MGWFKSLKKKISLKNFVKLVKKVVPFVPGGTLIKEGIEQAGEAFKGESKDKFPEAQRAGPLPSSQTELLLWGIVLVLFLMKGKR